MFQLNNRFVFHRTWKADIQAMQLYWLYISFIFIVFQLHTYCISASYHIDISSKNQMYIFGFYSSFMISGEWQRQYIVCLYSSFGSSSESMTEWLAHSGSVSLLRMEERARFPCSSARCGHYCQTHKSDCMFNKFQTETSLSLLLIIMIFSWDLSLLK